MKHNHPYYCCCIYCKPYEYSEESRKRLELDRAVKNIMGPEPKVDWDEALKILLGGKDD